MFGKKKYINLLNFLISNNLKFTTNWKKKDYKKNLLLRHDIDFSVEDAYEIAQIEKSMGLKSTFFFMVSSNMYNLFSFKNIKTIKKIFRMGHKISLHFDPTVYHSLKEFVKEKDSFEKFFDVKIDIISIHRPGIFLNKKNYKILGIKNSYNDIYTNDMEYISDSGGKDVFPKLKKYLAEQNTKGLQLLIHPIWWTSKNSSQTKTLNKWRNNYFNFIGNEIGKNCKTFKNY